MTQAAAHAVPTPAHGTSPGIHPIPHGHKVMERQQVPRAASPPWAGRTHPCSGHRLPQPWLPPPSLAPRGDGAPSAFPTWSCCQTTHCDTSSFQRLNSPPSCPKLSPTPAGASESQTPVTGPGLLTLVHLVSIYDGLYVFPRFDLTRYKLKPFCVGGEEEQFPPLLTNPL